MTLIVLLAGAALVMAVGYGLHRLALWAESRGWIYYRHRKPPPGATAMMLTEIDRIWKPEIEHVVDDMWSGDYRTVDDETGEDRL